MELLLIHNPRETKVSDQKIGIILGRPEQQVLWFEVAMYNAMVVQVRNRGERGSNQVGSIRLVVVTFPADAIEELTTKGKVCHQID